MLFFLILDSLDYRGYSWRGDLGSNPAVAAPCCPGFWDSDQYYLTLNILKNKCWFHKDSAIMYHHFIMDAKKH